MHNLSLNSIHEEIWNLMKNGIDDISSAFHFPNLSTINLDGYPTSRTVVLRSVNYENKVISFNTDIRSNKWVELKKNKNASIHIYDFKNKTQVRLFCSAFLNYNNKNWDEAWNSSTNMSKECYATPYKPSSIIDNPENIDININNLKNKELEIYKVNFGRVDLCIKSIDWLYLLHSGHRRAQFNYKKQTEMNWLAP